MRRWPRPFAAPPWLWTLVVASGLVCAGLAGQAFGLSGLLIASAPFVGVLIVMANASDETRSPDENELLTIFAAEQLLGRDLERWVRLPRTRRIWINRVITGTGVAIALIVIGLAST